MNDEYVSRLLYRLENHSSERELTDALGEMAESGSEIFMYPILSTYRKFKNTPISHYFLSALGAVNTPRSLTILKNVFASNDTKRSDKMWILPFFEKNNQYEDIYVNFCLGELLKLPGRGVMEDEDSDEYDLPTILSFLRSAKKLHECIELLEKILFDSSQRKAIRKFVLFYWIREYPDLRFKFLIENYRSIKDDDLDIILAKELISWKGGKVDRLVKLIKENGYPQAIEILEKSERNKQKANIQRKEDQYPNIDLVKEIINLRARINFLSQEKESLGFKIFAESENLHKQQESVNNRDTLVALCIDLRDILQNITVEATNHNLDVEGAKRYLPSISKSDLKKSLNSLHLNLATKGIIIESDFCGFRKLNQAVSLIAAHPKESEDLIRVLSDIKLIEVYKENNWQLLHNGLLKLYQQSLEKLEVLLKMQ